jgi:hypothetical protein
VGRHNCEVCLVLEEYYRLMLDDAILVARTAEYSPRSLVETDQDFNKAKERAVRAGRALLTHWQSCECRRPQIA